MTDHDWIVVLRAKYRDYCSARLADALLALHPEEIYTLAQAEADAESQAVPQSYNEAIRLATQRIRGDLDLPNFESWMEDYQRHPERYDPHLLGLWKSEESS